MYIFHCVRCPFDMSDHAYRHIAQFLFYCVLGPSLTSATLYGIYVWKVMHVISTPLTHDSQRPEIEARVHSVQAADEVGLVGFNGATPIDLRGASRAQHAQQHSPAPQTVSAPTASLEERVAAIEDAVRCARCWLPIRV